MRNAHDLIIMGQQKGTLPIKMGQVVIQASRPTSEAEFWPVNGPTALGSPQADSRFPYVGARIPLSSQGYVLI